MFGVVAQDFSRASVPVRPMRADDAAAVAELSGELGYSATAAALLNRFGSIAERADAQVYVAQASDGPIVGWVHVYGTYLLESDPHAEIGGLVVAEKTRGQGVGAALMSAAEAWAEEHGYGSVRVRSRIARAEAHLFYEHLGYSRIKTQHSFQKAIK